MHPVNERIKQVRKLKNLSQAAFGEPFGASRDMINNVENGRAAVSDMMVAAICRTYNVNENWLRTGEGEPFMQLSREDTIAAYVGKINGGKITDTEKCIIKFMAETPVEEWTELAATLRRFADEMKGAH